MSMEVVDEVMGLSHDQVHIVKGKRTKRQRPSSPLTATAALEMATTTTSNSSSGEGGGYDSGGGGGGGGGSRDGHSYELPTNSTGLCDRTEEEEDMANCLILLAQGYSLDNSNKFMSGRFTEPPTTNKAGFYLYQCKTCSRCFPSFQALGGHRASHKKPKIAGEKKTLMLLEDDYNNQFHSSNNHSFNLQMGGSMSGHRGASFTNNNKSKVHECSICGTEFSSGQALGGHMRRHRSSTTASITNTNATAAPTTTTVSMETLMMNESQSHDAKKQSTALSLDLDLNLPAPDEERDSKFSFASKQQPLLFSASSLVDCHY